MRTCFNCNGRCEVVGARMNHQPLAQSVKELENVKTFTIVRQENLLNAVVVVGATLISMIGMGVTTNANLTS